jgi:hypothetical protein
MTSRIPGRVGLGVLVLTAVVGCALPAAASDQSRMAADGAADRMPQAVSVRNPGDGGTQSRADANESLRRPPMLPTLGAEADEEAAARLLKALLERRRDLAQDRAEASLAQILLRQTDTCRRITDELAAVEEQRDRLQRQLEELMAIEEGIRARAKAVEIVLEP